MNYLCEYSEGQGYNYRFALEAKQTTTRRYLFPDNGKRTSRFIASLDRPELVGVKPRGSHEHMAGLNMTHSVSGMEAGKAVPY